MKLTDEFRNRDLALRLADRIAREAERPISLMEVCGTHTMAIARSGIKSLLPETVRLISGPGCPVCVTPQSQIDDFIEMGRMPDTILATFGDMMRVPGSLSSMEKERAEGRDVRVVYSPLDAVSIAGEDPNRQVVFFGIGFETTAPAVALAIEEARERRLSNFRVLCAHKVIPPAMEALAKDSEVGIDGFICPGHVSAITGSRVYKHVAHTYGIPCVIAGFEALDVLQAILMLIRQKADGRTEVENQYSRAVAREGNPEARARVESVFETDDSEWRGLGVIPGSGLRLRPEYRDFDPSLLLPERRTSSQMPEICECGSVLKGLKLPAECRAFGTACTPEHPLGPCMVSSEGACAAEHRYCGQVRGRGRN